MLLNFSSISQLNLIDCYCYCTVSPLPNFMVDDQLHSHHFSTPSGFILLLFIISINSQIQSQSDFGNKWTRPYYGGNFYDRYGYAFPRPHDPGMYAAAYGAYPVYDTHRQQVVLATWLFSKIK